MEEEDEHVKELGKENLEGDSHNLCFLRHKGKAKSKSLLSLIKNIILPKNYFSQLLLAIRLAQVNLLIVSIEQTLWIVWYGNKSLVAPSPLTCRGETQKSKFSQL